jgi:hypothetical protein
LVPEEEGLHECQASIKQSWIPMYGGGRTGYTLQLPDGAGFNLAKNQQVLVQLHLLNASTQDRTEKAFINMTFAPDPTNITPAGIFALGSMQIDIPIGAKGFDVVTQCNLPKQLNLFAVFPHMHQHGTKLVLEHGATSAADASVLYKRDPWVFGAQPMDAMTMTFNKGDFVRSTCTYDNTTDHDVMYGESSNDEMCYLILFYTPFDHLDGCVN